MTRVYKILAQEDWSAALAAGRFVGSPLDAADGFIHLSTSEQAAETARLHFHGRAGLVLLALDAERLGPDLVFEPSRGGRLFPHLYRPILPEEVVEVRSLALNQDGWPDPGPLPS